ncbi:MAG TPA: 2OG-Fe(II) oxygenase [Allosphingosinicella sp.]|nr:2OG-Fe(II) oxygenase [Allosphingosinicella sp.]
MSTQSRTMGDPGALYRMQIGTIVRDRLMKTPNAFKLPAQGLDIFVVRDFLSHKECADVIALIDKDRVPSGLLAPSDDPDFRTSESCNLRLEDRANQMVEAKINRLTGIDPTHGETIQGQRYAVGQQFKPHHDFFYTSQPYWPEMERQGGQRTWTAMIFLNTPEGGGQTAFPNANVRVTPRTGNLLLWNNLDQYGEPNTFSLHTGCPVDEGIKYIITKWYRERPWGWYAQHGVKPAGA